MTQFIHTQKSLKIPHIFLFPRQIHFKINSNLWLFSTTIPMLIHSRKSVSRPLTDCSLSVFFFIPYLIFIAKKPDILWTCDLFARMSQLWHMCGNLPAQNNVKTFPIYVAFVIVRSTFTECESKYRIVLEIGFTVAETEVNLFIKVG